MRRNCKFNTVAEVKDFYRQKELDERDALLNAIRPAMERNKEARFKREVERMRRIELFHAKMEAGIPL